MAYNTIDPAEYEKIKRMYLNGLVPMIRLAERYNVSRQGIWKLLKKLGVDTEKNGGVDIVCYHCKKEIKKYKSQMRLRSNHKFCSRKCWFAFVKSVCGGNEYKYDRQGQRLGRKVVSRYHTLQPGEIVHHEDKNCKNNTLANLKVFACQADHIRYHRGFDVTPVWSGVDIIAKRLKK
jgi:hypothetical protein